MAEKTHPALVLAMAGGLLYLLARRDLQQGSGNGNGKQVGYPLGELLNPTADLSRASIYVGEQVVVNFGLSYRGEPETLRLQAVLPDNQIIDQPLVAPGGSVFTPLSGTVTLGLSQPGKVPVTARIIGSTGWRYFEKALGEVIVYGKTFSDFSAGMGCGALLLPTTTIRCGPGWWCGWDQQFRFRYAGPAADVLARIQIRDSTWSMEQTFSLPASSTPTERILCLSAAMIGAPASGERLVDGTLYNLPGGEVLWQGLVGTLIVP